MKPIKTSMVACLPLAALTACGGGDTEDRLDIADPVVRFVDVSNSGPQVTLYRANVARGDVTNVSYGFASNYFKFDMGSADWSVRSSLAGTQIGSVSIDPLRGTKNTIVALDTSATTSAAYLIPDPHNKPLTSDSTRLRLMNGAYNVGSVDIYMSTPGADITTAKPSIAGTAIGTSGPAPSNDSIDIPGGTYQLTVTGAGTKTILFKGQTSFASNKDLLLVAVPAAAVPGSIRVLLKTEGVAGTTEIAVTN